ncbi:hypothetical protein NDU88_004505 [Pleurodeles waltl]|uniref:Uncharacterized protein n=1 Tax=Pleurodeles waltl TaxID=8319 RepID=A0AAV7NME7_PLEWA|nr:hypothetical protein NDU88_004505 [Pleurodeles waltl]
MVVRLEGAHAHLDTRSAAKVRKQALFPVKTDGVGAPQAGCDGTHALGEHREQSTRRLGRLAQVKKLPVRVRTPSGHWLEERAQSGAGEVKGPCLGVQDFYPLRKGVPSTSRSAVSMEQEVIDDMLLDYEEEEELEGGTEWCIVHCRTRSG